MKIKEQMQKILSYFTKKDNALVAIQDKQYGHIAIEMTPDIDDILMEVTSKYIEQQYSNFDGMQHIQRDCIDFYRNKFNKLFDDMENELC